MIIRSVFYCNRSSISILDVDEDPQSCIPYDQIGLIIVLYIRSLLLTESFDFRPSNWKNIYVKNFPIVNVKIENMRLKNIWIYINNVNINVTIFFSWLKICFDNVNDV